MTIFESWDIVVVRFPFIDAPSAKPRPTLVLSGRAFNERNAHTIVAMITRATRALWPDDHAIADLPATGLKVPSVVRWKLFTLDNHMLHRRIGNLAPDDAARCREALARILAG